MFVRFGAKFIKNSNFAPQFIRNYLVIGYWGLVIGYSRLVLLR